MNSADYLQYDYLLDQACEKLSDDILKCDTVDDVKKNLKLPENLQKMKKIKF